MVIFLVRSVPYLFWRSLCKAFCNELVPLDKSHEDTLGKPPGAEASHNKKVMKKE